MGRPAPGAQAAADRARPRARRALQRGCITRGYFSSVNATLPAAGRTGRLTLRPHSIVRSVLYDETRDGATGVRMVDAETRAELEFTARVVFLCASAFESVRILLNSATRRFTDGLASSSGQRGRGIMDHIKWGGASGTMEGWTDRHEIGSRPNGIYVPRFRNVHDRQPDFIRGYGFQGGASRADWRAALRAPGVGAALKRRLDEPGPWVMRSTAPARCWRSRATASRSTPRSPTRGTSPHYNDCAWGDNELAMYRDMNVAAAELLEAAGATDIRPSQSGPSTPGNSNHEMGGARMGRDRRTFALNAHDQTWDVPNPFVTDGACMTSSACRNPSLTHMALTARACDLAVEELKRGNL